MAIRLLLILFFFCSLGCLERRSARDYGLPIENTLRFQLPSEPPTLDWSISTDSASSLILYNIMEGLVDLDFDDPKLGPKPGLASYWTTDDGKLWKFFLKKNVFWSDGVILTTQHVRDGFERCLNPDLASQSAFFLHPILNAEKYNSKEIENFNEVGVRIKSEHEVHIELEEPMAAFPYLLVSRCSYPVRSDLIAQHGDRWTDPKNLVTLGAYRVKRWDHDRAIVLERSSTYHGSQPQIPFLIGYVITESSTALSLFESGRLDLTSELPSKLLKKLKSKPEFRSYPILGTYFYNFNTSKKMVDQALVRKAISMAIDRSELVTMIQGGEEVLGGWIPKGMIGYDPNVGLAFNPIKAKQLLVAAGFGPGKKKPRLKLGFNTMEDHSRIAENIQAQLKKNLGLRVDLVNEEWKSYLVRIQVNPPALFRLGWVADYPDPDNFMSFMMGNSANNRTRWKNKEFDRLVRRARGELNPDVRVSLYKKAQKILVEDDVPVLPLFNLVSRILVSSRIEYLPTNPLRIFQFKRAKLKAQSAREGEE